VVALLERRPRLLLCGFFFPFLRLVDAAIGIYAMPMAWLSRSNGRWKSPTRSIQGSSQMAGAAHRSGMGATCAVFMGDGCHASG